MTERRIPYSLPMARARRAGLKTMTRRVWKMPRGCSWYEGHGGEAAGMVQDDDGPAWWHVSEQRCPYGQPGDILLPVEPWRAPVEWDNTKPADIPAGTPIWLDANGPAPAGFGRYRHARFMPAHLITARDEVVSVRVERLQDISEADAIAEGCDAKLAEEAPAVDQGMQDYRALWESLHGLGSWDRNEWVWVVEFRVMVP